MPGRDKLPDTLKRSPKKAQRTWAKTHDSKKELARAIASKQ